MKGAILKMKKKYSTAVAKRKKKAAAAKKDGDVTKKKRKSSSSKRSKEDKTMKSSSSSKQQQRPRKDSNDMLSVGDNSTYASQDGVSRSFESYGSGSASHTNRPSQHSRGRSPTLRPRRMEGRDDGSLLSGEYDDESHDEGDYSSYYGTTSYDSSDDDDDDDGSSSHYYSDSQYYLHSEDEGEQHTDDDEEYAENKLRDIGTVIRAAPSTSTHAHAANHRVVMDDRVVEDDDNDDESEEDDNSASVFSDGSHTVTDKSLDSTEEEEFQEFLQKQRAKKKSEGGGGGGGFFWMLGFGKSHEQEEADTETAIATAPPEDDTNTLGESTVLSDLPDDVDEDAFTMTGGQETDQEDGEASFAENASDSSMIKHDKTFETTQVKSGCFLGLIGSNDSIDGSYGGLRDGDILIADSRSFDTQAAFTDVEDSKHESVAHRAACSVTCSPTQKKRKHPKRRKQPRKKPSEQKEMIEGSLEYSDKTDAARATAEPVPSPTQSPTAAPFALFSFFEPSKTASIENLTSGDSGLRGTKIPLLDSAPSGSTLEETTIVLHSILEPQQQEVKQDDDEEDQFPDQDEGHFLQKDAVDDQFPGQDEGEFLQHGESLEDDVTSYGDSTIMTDQQSTNAPLFVPKLEKPSARPLTPLNEVERATEQSLSSSMAGSSAVTSTHSERMVGRMTPSSHSERMTDRMTPSSHSRTAMEDQSTNHSRIQYSQHGRKLTVSFHKRSNFDPDTLVDHEERSESDQVSQSTVSTATYKEEFELELGSYANTYSDSTSSSSENDSMDDGPKRKKAERLDNYDISEIVHGRRRFMPKPKAGGTLGTAYREALRSEPSSPTSPVHPLNMSASGGGLRRERRLHALKAHRDFLYGNTSEAQPSGDILSIESSNVDARAEQVFSLQEHALEEPSIDGNGSLGKVQPSAEWIEKTWQSLGTEEMEPDSTSTGVTENAKGESTASENSLAIGHTPIETQAQQADALVDLVRTALNGMLSNEVPAPSNATTGEDNGSMERDGPEQQPVFVPDVFQAAYDFFGITSQQTATLSNMEKASSGDALQVMGFNPNPRTAKEENKETTRSTSPVVPIENNLAYAVAATLSGNDMADGTKPETITHGFAPSNQEESMQSEEQDVAPENAARSSPDITSHSDEAILDHPSSKGANGTHKKNDTMRFNVDGIPLELRPKKIWKAFDSFSAVDAKLNMEEEVLEAFGQSANPAPSASVDQDADQESQQSDVPLTRDVSKNDSVNSEADEDAKKETTPPKAPTKHAEALRFKSRRLRHVSRIAEKRQHTNVEKNDPPSPTSPAKPSDANQNQSSASHTYSGDATAYRQQVMDIRSRLRHRRRTKVFRESDQTTSSPTESPEKRDDSSSNSDEFFDANSSVAEEKQGAKALHEDGIDNNVASAEKLNSAAKPPKPPLRYELYEKTKEPPEEHDPILESRSSQEESSVSESQRSRGSMYSAFSLD